MMRGGAGLLGLLLVMVTTAAAPAASAGEPLVDAAKRGDAAAVRTLLRQGADPKPRCTSRRRPATWRSRACCSTRARASTRRRASASTRRCTWPPRGRTPGS
jgi:hypothetical protein